MAIDLLSAVAFLLFTLLGSISIGYLVLRFTYPEVRTFDKNKKLLTALLVGACISLTAMAVDFASLGLDRLLSLDSFYITFALFSTIFYFLLLRVYSIAYTSRQEFITVGVPIPSKPKPSAPQVPVTIPKPKKPEPVKTSFPAVQPPSPPMPIAPPVPPLPPAPIITPAPSAKPTVPTKPLKEVPKPPTPTKPSAAPSVPPKPLLPQITFPKIELPKISLPAAPSAPPAPKPPAREQLPEVKKLGAKPEPTKPPSPPAKQPIQPQAPSAPPPHPPQPPTPPKPPQPMQVQPPKPSPPMPPAPKAPPAYLLAVQQKAHELEKAPAAKPHEKKPVEKPSAAKPQKAPAVPAKVSVKPVEATGAKLEELKKEIGTEPLEINIPFKTAAVVSKPAPAAVTPSRPGEIEVPGKKAETPPEPLQPQRPSIANAFGLLAEKPAAAPKEAAPQQPPGFKSWRARQAGEQRFDEAEQVLSDIMKTTKQQAQAQTGPVHRRYMLQEGQQVKVIADKQLAQKEEFNVLVQDIYSQLKTTKKEPSLTETLAPAAPETPLPQPLRAPVVPAKKPPAAAAPQPAPVQASPAPEPITTANAGLSLSDVLGTEPTPAPAAAGTELFGGGALPGGEAPAAPSRSLFSQLEAISTGKPAAPAATPTAPQAQSDVSFVQIKAERGMGCPTCHSQNSKIVFCPYCGTGMCANCSPSIKSTGPGQFVYTCPKCGEEISVNKRT